MKLSVKARIALVITLVVAVNIVAGLVSWDLYRSASQSSARARIAAERARDATAASGNVTEFIAAASDLALAVSKVTASEERSRSYGTLIGADPTANRAIARVAKAAPGDAGPAAVSAWDSLRVTTYAWINTEAEAGGADFRITRNANGAFRDSVSSNISLPGELQGVSGTELRQAVRDRAERFKYSTLGAIMKSAQTDLTRAVAAEARARRDAQRGTAALVGFSAFVAALLGVGLYRSISRPLSAARSYADLVAGGEYGTAAPTHTADEIGVLTRAVENMKDSLVHEMSVMREMAGAVIVTVEAVEEAVSSTETLVQHPDRDAASVNAGLADVRKRVDTLQTLSRQMLGI